MTDCCQHEQQVRHLKSRVNQLEIMLDKERRLRNSPQPSPVRAADVTTTPEYRKLMSELDTERRVKAELKASLVEATTACAAQKAAHIQEMTELQTGRDALRKEMSQVQEELIEARSTLEKRDGEMTIMTARAAQHDDLTAAMEALRTDTSLTDLANMCDTEPTLSATCAAALQKIEILTVEQAKSTLLLQQTVPALFEDLFTLLNRSSSFIYPPKTSSLDDSANEAYSNYLKSTSARLSHTIKKYITSHQKSRQKISYRGFAAGDLALFLPTRNAQSPAWAAFNVGAPHYFLDMTGVVTDGKDFLIGRIQDIEEKVGEPGVETNAAGDVRRWWQVRILEKKKNVD